MKSTFIKLQNKFLPLIKLKDGSDVKPNYLWEQFLEIKKHLNLKLNFAGRNSEEGNVESDKLANSALDLDVDPTANEGNDYVSAQVGTLAQVVTGSYLGWPM